MYRLSGPNLIIYIPILAIGILIVTFIPNYMGALRVLSFTSLLIGEAGMSFIPVLLFFPKATLRQVLILSFIYLLTTFIICISSWGFYTLALTNRYAFLWQDNEFHINTYALFAANIFSLINLVLCFKLIYDEELAQTFQHKKKSIRKEGGFKLGSFKSPLLKRPSQGTTGTASTYTSKETPSTQKISTSSKTKTDDFFFEEELNKPFQFEPDISSLGNLPEESSGKLFAGDEEAEHHKSEFFDDEETEHQARKIEDSISIATKPKPKEETKQKKEQAPKSTMPSIIPPPTDIKNDLTMIFEQYSSLNAIKKLTSRTGTSKELKRKEKRKKPYVLSKETPEVSMNITDDIHEGSYRLVSEAEKIAEVKENLKKEINQEILSKIDEKKSQIEESLGKTEVLKDDILNSIKDVKNELLKSIKEEIETKFTDKTRSEEKDLEKDQAKEEMTKELQQHLLEKLDQKISQIEESTQKHAEKIEQIKETIKEEINKDLLSKIGDKTSQIEESISQTEILKREILDSIRNVKVELLDSLKKEIDQKFEHEKVQKIEEPVKLSETIIEQEPSIPFQEQEKDIDDKNTLKLENMLNSLIQEPKIKGLQFISLDGVILAEKWHEGTINKTNSSKTTQFYNALNNEITKTNQGALCNVLLESENEIIVLTKLENKILTVYTEGTGSILSGQILRAVSKAESNNL